MSTSASLDDRPLSSWEDLEFFVSLLVLKISSCSHKPPPGPGLSISAIPTSGYKGRNTSSYHSSLPSIANCSTFKSPMSKPIGLKILKSELGILCPLPKNKSNTNQSTETICPLGTTHSSTYLYRELVPDLRTGRPQEPCPQQS